MTPSLSHRQNIICDFIRSIVHKHVLNLLRIWQRTLRQGGGLGCRVGIVEGRLNTSIFDKIVNSKAIFGFCKEALHRTKFWKLSISLTGDVAKILKIVWFTQCSSPNYEIRLIHTVLLPKFWKLSDSPSAAQNFENCLIHPVLLPKFWKLSGFPWWSCPNFLNNV